MISNRKKIVFTFWLYILPYLLIAQGEMGLSHGNYNVTEAIRLNPAAAVDPRPYFDFHVVGGYGLLENNFIYFDRKNSNSFVGQLSTTPKSNSSHTKKSMQLEANAYGPAFNYPFGRFSVGISTAIRNYLSVRDIPFHLAKNYFENWKSMNLHGQSFESSPFRVNALSWEELGVHFGGIVHMRGFDMVNVAFNLKYLIGSGAFSFHAKDFSYSVQNQSDITFSNISAEYAAAVPGLNRGKGWGIDLGVQYKKMLEVIGPYEPHSLLSNCKQIDYKYKIGFSILDLGFINFTNSSFHREVQNGNSNLNGFNPSGVRGFIDDFDQQFEGSIAKSTGSFKAYLPATMSVQYDYNLENNFFLNGTAIFSFSKPKKFGAERLSMLAFTPRYEKPRFEVATPVSINQFLRPGIGLAVRFWFISFGTDNIIPYFIGDAYRLDAYFHLKWKFLQSNRCKIDILRPAWRVNDCTAPRKDSRTKKRFRKDNKSRLKRDKKRRKRYGGS